jgi:Family of unknown function (DUF6505)
MRLPRTLLVEGDQQAFSSVAAPGEWAISGAFIFSDREPGMLIGRDLAAFRTGFLGTIGFGWASRVEVAEIDEAAYGGVIDAIARHLLEHFDAPDLAAARAFADEEAKFAQSLCDRPTGTQLAVERSFGPQGIAERFRVVTPPSARSG